MKAKRSSAISRSSPESTARSRCWRASVPCCRRPTGVGIPAMEIAPLKGPRDYRRALKEIEGLMHAKRNTPEGDHLDILITLVEAIKYHMDQNGLAPRDLIPFIGRRNRVHEVLNRRRPLTLKMIQRLHAGLRIPAESLLKIGRERAA